MTLKQFNLKLSKYKLYKDSVRQSSYIQSLSIENTMKVPHLGGDCEMCTKFYHSEIVCGLYGTKCM